MFFVLGFAAKLAKAELQLPKAIYEYLSAFLLISIGLKGGIELAKSPLSTFTKPIVLVLAMGIIIPLIAYPLLKALKFKHLDAASIAAHYGSVSVGTYAVGVSYLSNLDINFESYMPLFLVVLEIPAIIVGILLAKGIKRISNWKKLAHEIFLGKGIVLLVGGLLIGWLGEPSSINAISPFFFGLFKGMLALFLLEMGIIAASQVSSLKRYGIPLIGFGILFPIFTGLIGAGVSTLIGLSIGGSVLLATLAASASYIAVPAAFRMAVPKANSSLSLTASLGITFPFNIILGIPIYHWMVVHIFS